MCIRDSNQVRTASSLNFHSYDLALPAVTDEAAPTTYSQRVLKAPDRPRRENIDTAAWLPNLQTDATGKTRFSFVPVSYTHLDVYKSQGAPRPAANILLTDGAGVLDSGVTDGDGVLIINRPSPERSYVIGADPAGGVFVSENFYYDSEIYAAKLYAFTDRPLYRSGDTVCLKLVGRVFQDSRHSTRLTASGVRLAVLDPNGTPVTTGDFNVVPDAGGDTCFCLLYTSRCV